ncbi:MAG TPA: sulfotransferase [Gammaproteobacteria bacterium]|nr:sulfotransferase [Gammaproteobacteria bacterium]
MNTATDQHIATRFQQAAADYAQGKSDLAESGARTVIALDPNHAGAYHLLGAIRLDGGDAINALPLLENALRLSPNHPGIQLALGNAHFALEHWHEAVQFYDRFSLAGNSNGIVILSTAIALHKLKETRKAVEVLRKGTELYPDDPALWNAYGDLLNKENEDIASIQAHERAVALMPENPDYVANLALMYEQSNRMEEAERTASAMLQQHPQHPLLLLICIRCARRKKNYEHALALLDRMPQNANLRFKRACLFEAGRVHDYLKQADKAYQCFLEGNKLTLDLWPTHRPEAAAFLADWQALHHYVTSRQSLAWPDFPAESGRPKHVFLLGFMRSGTTLMDTILETHPQIKVLEEDPPIHDVVRAIEAFPGNYPACLETLTEEQVKTLRTLYWENVTKLTGPLAADTVLLDKQPLLGPHAGLVHTLFPDAKFIFALRHPCDVVLSSFMQPFGHNPFHANFLTLEQSASVYALVMDMWLAYQRLFHLDIHTLRYESLISNKQQALADVFQFMGLSGAETDIDHVTHAKKRGRIYTPSYHQVVQPLYSDAMERWRRYRAYFEPVLPLLRPYIERFGYTA